MARLAWKTRAAIAAAAAGLGCVAIVAVPSQTVLAVRAQRSGELRFTTGMSEGDEFVIAYVHSVNRRPVFDTLRVEGGGLRIVKSRFDAFGAGIPDTSTPGHPLRSVEGGWLEYTVDRRVEDVALFVGRVAQHTLKVKGRDIPLARLAPPGSAVRFTVERQSLLQLWRGPRP